MLSVSDYGIYSVVGGIVVLLGFITNALVITTQRYVSFYHGKGEKEVVRQIFKNSLFLHILIGLALGFFLLSLRGWLIGDILNIPPDRKDAASIVYVIATGMLLITIITSPFKALLIARENIIYITIIEIADSIIKTLIALSLSFIHADLLLVYAYMMGGILVLNLLAFASYSLIKYEECSILIRPKDIERKHLKQITGFAGWTTYGMGAIATRNQGGAIIFNHFHGTAINAAYGIAFQIFAAISFVVTSIANAMNPQIMKAEGRGERELMLSIAGRESKFSVALLALASIPIMVEMPSLLSLWLTEVPPHTSMFCRFILLAFLCDQFTLGLNTAIQATGNIRTYSLLVYTPKFIYLPIAWGLLFGGFPIKSAMWVYLIIECIVAAIRIPYANHAVGLNPKKYLKNVILPLLPLCLLSGLASICCARLMDMNYRFILTFLLSTSVGLITGWFFTLSTHEREYVRNIFNHLRVCFR